MAFPMHRTHGESAVTNSVKKRFIHDESTPPHESDDAGAHYNTTITTFSLEGLDESITKAQRSMVHRWIVVLLLAALSQTTEALVPPSSRRRLTQSQTRISSAVESNTQAPLVLTETTTPYIQHEKDELELTQTLEIASMNVEADFIDEAVDESSFTFPITIMVLCWGVTFLSALDRVAMSVAMLPLSTEFGYTETIKGQISSIFSVGYGFMILPVGVLLSVASPRLVMGTGVALWSLGTLVTPLAADNAAAALTPLLVARMAVGASESVVLPTVQRILTTWIPDERRSLSTAIIFSGFQAGTMAAFMVSPYVMDVMEGWRGLFFTYGALGLVWLIPWMMLAKDAPQGVALPNVPEALVKGAENQPADSWQSAFDTIKSAPIREMYSSRGIQAILMAHAANNWGLYINLAWTPTFYAEQYGMNVKDSAFLSIAPSVAGAVCGLCAGAAADAWIQRESDSNNNDERMTRIRKTFQGIGLFGPAICLAVLAHHIPEEPWVAQALLTGTVGLQAFNAGGYGPATQEKAGPKWSGLLYSLTSLPGVMLGSLGVYATGQILDLTHQDWGLVYSLTALVNVAGATGFVTMYNATKEFD